MPTPLRHPVYDALVQDNGPFALARAQVGELDQVVFRHGAQNLLEIYRKASRTGNRPFLAGDRQTVTYQALSRRAAAYAALFSSRGIARGMHVSLALSDDADWIATFIAVTAMGAVAVLAGSVTGCDAVIADQPRQGEKLVVTAAELAAVPVDKPWQFPAAGIDPDMDACIAFTSGSSGTPKGVILTHRGLITGLMNMMLAGSMAARNASPIRAVAAKPAPSCVLLRTPLHHVSGYMQMLLMLMLGGTLVRSGRRDLCAMVVDHQITSVTGISDDEIMALSESVAPLDPLRSVSAVGREVPAVLRRRLREKWRSLGLGSGYGLTETCGLVSAIGSDDLDACPRAVGVPLPTVEVRIAGIDNAHAPDGQAGLISLRGAMMMRGYWNSPAHQMPGGWFATGDVGFIAGDGMLHVLGRADRFLRLGAGLVSCSEVEDAIRAACPSMDVAALPLPDNERGDSLLVVAADWVDAPLLKNLLAYRFPALPEPRFVMRGTLPRTASGKVAYSQLLAETVSAG